jgi:acetyl-CoA carboxylase biotin carboxyl carrier protein
VTRRTDKRTAGLKSPTSKSLNMSKNSQLDTEIHHLVELLNRHELAELEVEHKGLRIRVRRGGSADSAPLVMTESGRQPLDQPGTTTTHASAPSSLTTVTSPIVGTFYRSASPDADAYVDEGDFVKKGQVLCIVEAMKLMNEIESEVDGRVHKILAESAKPVEYGQPLFLIDSAATP